MKKPLLLILLTALSWNARAGDSLRVLFIGNSYTYLQMMPEVVKNLANNQGHDIDYEMVAPGGYTLEEHWTNQATLNNIATGSWDYVVLQEQSQLPSFPDPQVEQSFYPYAGKLDSLIHVYSPCAKTVLYMTWGRENGDAQNCAAWPPVCTYEGMDSLLRLRYTNMADTHNTLISPAGPLFRYTRINATPIDLYQSDGSHPSISGTYLIALGFYTLFFEEDPTNNTYNSTLSFNEAQTLRNMAKAVAYDSLHYWQHFGKLLDAEILHDQLSDMVFSFSAGNPKNVTGYEWDFGDGSPYSYQPSPTHTYAQSGTYTVCLTVYNECDTLTICMELQVEPSGISQTNSPDLQIGPNPVNSKLYISGLNQNTGYKIIDATGRIQRSGSLHTGEALELQGLSPGWYLLQLNNNGEIGTYRYPFMKN